MATHPNYFRADFFPKTASLGGRPEYDWTSRLLLLVSACTYYHDYLCDGEEDRVSGTRMASFARLTYGMRTLHVHVGKEVR